MTKIYVTYNFKKKIFNLQVLQIFYKFPTYQDMQQ